MPFHVAVNVPDEPARAVALATVFREKPLMTKFGWSCTNEPDVPLTTSVVELLPRWAEPMIATAAPDIETDPVVSVLAEPEAPPVPAAVIDVSDLIV
ncbi:hypothetical protein [Bradyrhizobium sp. AZCC 2230]|uniref:hypothetical protein n=1 Tax=Bradyrhizobium sp. AZCC 2230 TaxID=3117021 RepID=UPI002FF2D1EA